MFKETLHNYFSPHHTLVILSGEQGKKTFDFIRSSMPGTFNAKEASKQAHKLLRKQGFYM